MKIDPLEPGRLWVSERFAPLFRHLRLQTFEQVMALQGGRMRRDFPGRRTHRLELTDAQGRTQAVYLKRYYPDYLSAGQRLLRRWGCPAAQDEARQEWENIQALHALQIPTVEPVAFGQDHGSRRWVTSSFVMTAELTGAEEAHLRAAQLSAPARRALLLDVAALARRFHAADLVHKDFYLSHFLLRPNEAGGLFLIDLQRVTRPRWFRERWLVKDLGALVYSSLKAGATWKDLAAGFKVYRGSRPLSPADRRLAGKVLGRVAWLKTRTPKHDKDFQQLK